MLAADTLVDWLVSRGHRLWVEDGRLWVSDSHLLSDKDREEIRHHRDVLVEMFDTPIHRAGRAKGKRWRQSLGPLGRSLLRVICHEQACEDCARGAMHACERGRQLYSEYRNRKDTADVC